MQLTLKSYNSDYVKPVFRASRVGLNMCPDVKTRVHRNPPMTICLPSTTEDALHGTTEHVLVTLATIDGVLGGST